MAFFISSHCLFVFKGGEENKIICGGVKLSNRKISDLESLVVSSHFGFGFFFLDPDTFLSSIFIG